MHFLELLILSAGLSMDAFAVSVCKGLSMKKVYWTDCCICGLWFGGFQALMPVIGFFLGSVFARTIASYDHWVSFILMTLIGANMIREAFNNQDAASDFNPDLSVGPMLILAVSTSIDALAVGVSLAMAGEINIMLTAGLIGLVTFGFSAAGVRIGNLFGSRYEKMAEAAGGILLILLGLNILFEHLGD